MQEKLKIFRNLGDLRELDRASSTVSSVSARGVSVLLCIAAMGRKKCIVTFDVGTIPWLLNISKSVIFTS